MSLLDNPNIIADEVDNNIQEEKLREFIKFKQELCHHIIHIQLWPRFLRNKIDTYINENVKLYDRIIVILDNIICYKADIFEYLTELESIKDKFEDNKKIMDKIVGDC